MRHATPPGRKRTRPSILIFVLGALIALGAATAPSAIGSSVASSAAPAAAPTAAQEVEEDVYSDLRYRFIGPDGNRTSAIVGEVGDPDVVYVGAASGGIFRTTNGGIDWEPVFDDQEVASIGSLAVSRSDPNVVWAGTGETFIIRPALGMGNGIYRSQDGGDTWEHRGLEATGRIGRIVVDPRDPDVVLACALGHAFAPQPERGVYRTEDGGATWERVLFVDERTGCSDLAMDPTNPRIVFAGMWQVRIDTGGLHSGGPGSGVYRSTDGGRTWEKLSGEGRGLPGGEEHPVGKVAVDVAASDPERVYALVEDVDPGFYRSDDGGDSWRLVSRNHTIDERAPYYTRFAVSPDDADTIYFVSVYFSKSVDGGETLVEDPPRGGGDAHDIWIDPTNADRILVADDVGSANMTLDGGESWEYHRLPIAQIYHVEVDDRIPYRVYGNRQDGYSYRGPSNSRAFGGIPLGMWEGVGGCESGWATPDPVDDDVVWSGCYDGGLERYDDETGQWRDVRVWPEAGYGWPPAEMKYRWHWNFPLEISPHDHERVYVGSQHVHVTENAGQSWEVISPDLTTDDPERQQDSGGLTVDNLFTFDGSVLFALAESPLQEGLIWAGSNDGRVHVTRDGGETWTDVSGNVPGLDVTGWIKNVEPSRHDPATAYMAVSRHQEGDFSPYVFVTRDGGESWESIGDGIPESPFSFVHVVREDPERPGMLWVGTENGVWFTLDDGGHWMPLRQNMPPAPVYWLTIQERFDDLVVGTYGRGFWILDDVTPLRALGPEVLESRAYLFEPQPAWRFRPVQGIHTESGSEVTGSNPEYGANIDYLLGEELAGREVEIAIEDADGEVIRTLEGGSSPGINRVTWDLRHAAPARPKLRTRPPGRDWVELGEDGWRSLRTWDLDVAPGFMGPLAVPGTYTVRVTVAAEATGEGAEGEGGGDDAATESAPDETGDRESEETGGSGAAPAAVLTGELEVRKDPHSAGTLADIEAQHALSMEIRDAVDDAVEMIDGLEWVRKELRDLIERYGGDPEMEPLLSAAGELDEEALDVERILFDIHLTGAREDAFRNPMKLYGRLGALGNDVGRDSADFPPTDQQLQVFEVLEGRLEEARAGFRQVMEESLPAFNARLLEAGLPTPPIPAEQP